MLVDQDRLVHDIALKYMVSFLSLKMEMEA